MKDKIRNEILETLDIRDADNFSDIELFRLLDKKRKSLHPDRTTDEVVKKEYEEKVKKLNDLYKRFGEHIKVSPSNENNLQIYKGEVEFDYISAKIENDELKEKIKSLENEIYFLKRNIESKDETIKKLNDTKVKEETEKLKNLYRPKKSNIIVLGISAFLSGLVLILTSTEQAVTFYSKYLPMINPSTVNLLTLGVLIFVTLLFAVNYIKKVIINSWTEKINSTFFISKLFDFVKTNIEPQTPSKYDFDYTSKTYKFKERVIYDFIDSEFKPKWKFAKYFRWLIGLNTFSVYENFKRIIIFELINKGIITIYGNSGFDKILKYDE